MKHFINAAMLNAALVSEFARIGIRASTFIVASVRAACKTASVKAKDVSKEELRAHVDAAIAYLTAKGCPPANKDGTAYTAQRVGQFASDCVRTLHGQQKKKVTVQPVNPAVETEGGEISAAVPMDKTPHFDASALTLQDAAKVPVARELAAKLKGNKNADVAALAAFVLEFFA